MNAVLEYLRSIRGEFLKEGRVAIQLDPQGGGRPMYLRPMSCADVLDELVSLKERGFTVVFPEDIIESDETGRFQAIAVVWPEGTKGFEEALLAWQSYVVGTVRRCPRRIKKHVSAQ